jgi:hypothetical protein
MMALDRTEILLEEIRNRANIVDWDETSGIHDNEILGYLNDAQEHLQEAISNRGYMVFEGDYETPVVANQEFYPLPDDAFTGNRVRTVSYSRFGRPDDWENIKPTTIQYRDATPSSCPANYILANGGIFLVGVPQYSQGFLRIFYERALDRVDKRRGEISNVTVAPNSTIVEIFLAQNEWLDETHIKKRDYLCVSDADGNVLVYNAPIYSYDETQKMIVTHIQVDDPSIASEYITLGKYTTTHSKLPANCRRYLSTYVQIAVQDRDTLDVPVSQDKRLMSMEGSLIATFSLLDKNNMEIRVSDYWFS